MKLLYVVAFMTTEGIKIEEFNTVLERQKFIKSAKKVFDDFDYTTKEVFLLNKWRNDYDSKN